MSIAAKEAVVKAMGTGFTGGMRLRDAGVTRNALGRPEIVWSERGLLLCRQLGVGQAHLTLTDDSGIAIAVVILMRS
jgi:holo-[acyl-carrier protein] synthase